MTKHLVGPTFYVLSILMAPGIPLASEQLGACDFTLQNQSLKAVFGDRLDLSGAQTRVDLGIAERSKESVHMLLELENSASEGSRRVKNCVPKHESAIPKGQEYLTLRHDASIEIGDALAS